MQRTQHGKLVLSTSRRAQTAPPKGAFLKIKRGAASSTGTQPPTVTGALHVSMFSTWASSFLKAQPTVSSSTKRKINKIKEQGFVVWGGWGHTSSAQGPLLTGLRGLEGELGIEPGPAACMASALPAVLSFWPR